ncbi:hypothetical protein QVD17_11995 [Tagetes erecta]|uniref:Uncharacterized protein n=1 Tax=Tagetes erecta TaxID=13708 RepID=A0AAD8L0M6_TARER|nr:hypothetical protein QVD17_11995 [Tagetes erecta]
MIVKMTPMMLSTPPMISSPSFLDGFVSRVQLHKLVIYRPKKRNLHIYGLFSDKDEDDDSCDNHSYKMKKAHQSIFLLLKLQNCYESLSSYGCDGILHTCSSDDEQG